MESYQGKLWSEEPTGVGTWAISLILNDSEEVPLPPGLDRFNSKADAEKACYSILESIRECGLPIRSDERPYGWVGYSLNDGVATVWRCSVYQSSRTKEKVDLV